MINRRPSRSEIFKRMGTEPPEENNETFESLARRILTLWQDQIRLTASDVELQGYGTEMFKALGISPDMPPPSTEMEQNIEKDGKDNDDSPIQSKFATSDSGHENGTAPSELSPEHRAAMVDELARRIDELAGRIAEFETDSISQEPD